MGLLIDSSVLITVERSGGNLDELLSSLINDEPLAIAAITASELLHGVYRAENPSRRMRREAYAENVFDRIAIIPFDLEIARVYAQAQVQLILAGQTIGTHDLLIAATALTHDYAVLTDNVRDFNRVPGLQVRRPDW
jgi:tRNA(fMet)-specific endonuclease VapC